MNASLKILLVMATLFFSEPFFALSDKKDTYTLSHFYKKEVINGITFIYEEEIINGRYKGSWLVEDRAVSPEAFEEKITQAEKEACHKQRRQEFEQRMNGYKKKHEAEIHILKKLIQSSMKGIREWLKKIDELCLEQYLVFNDQTFHTREQFLCMPQELETQAQELLDASFANTEVAKLKSLVQKLDDIDERLRILVYESLDDAIKRCDDPSMLKKLLGAIERL